MSAFSQLQSQRLILRRLQQGDVSDIHAYRSMPDVARYQSWSYYLLGDAEDLIKRQAATPFDAPGSWVQLAIVWDGELIGDCGVHTFRDSPSDCEIGITMHPDHHGQGFAAEAVSCVVSHWFSKLRKRSFRAVVDSRNQPAVRLFEGLGFQRDPQTATKVRFKGEWAVEITFVQASGSWHSGS